MASAFEKLLPQEAHKWNRIAAVSLQIILKLVLKFRIKEPNFSFPSRYSIDYFLDSMFSMMFSLT